MDITLNGDKFSLEGEIAVSALVERLSLDTRKIAIERNLEIIPKSQYSSALIKSGDRIEIVGFIGGG